MFYFIVFPLTPVIHDLRFLVDQLPKIGPCYSLCIWQVTGYPPNHGSGCVLLYLISMYFPIVIQQSEYHLGPALCPSASPSHSLSFRHLVHLQSALLRLCSILPDPCHIQVPATFIHPLLQSPLPVPPCKSYNTARPPVQYSAELYPTALATRQRY